MKLTSLGLKAAALTAVVASSIAVGATPSHALTLSGGDTIDFGPAVGSSAKVLGTKLNNPSKATITGFDFMGGPNGTGGIQVTDATGEFFESFLGQIGSIQDITFTNGVAGPKDSFFTIGSGLVFNLTKATTQIVGNIAGFNFDGKFTTNSGDFIGFGSVSTQVNLKNGQDKPSSFSGTAETKVPTPALLPGLVGMGVAALRKRKQVEETVKA